MISNRHKNPSSSLNMSYCKQTKTYFNKFKWCKSSYPLLRRTSWKGFDSKFESIFDLFRGPSYAPSHLLHSMSPRGDSQSNSGDAPGCKKPDNKSSPTCDRTLPMGMDAPRHFLVQMYMRNWLIHWFNRATGCHSTWIVLYDATRSYESTSSMGRSRGEWAKRMISLWLCGQTMQ